MSQSSVTRRGFLGAMLAMGAAPAIVRAGSLMPLWVQRDPGDLIYTELRGNQLVTLAVITREALRLLDEKASFIRTINRQFEAGHASDLITVRVPLLYRAP